MKLILAGVLAVAGLLSAPPAGAAQSGALSLKGSIFDLPADTQCDVYDRSCNPQYCYSTNQWVGPFSGYCPDILGPPYGRGNSRDTGDLAQ
jgi:hypothetical protein